MYISLMGKILNSPKGVKSGVLESVIIFAAHVATVIYHCVPKLMTQSQTTDAFTEHVLTQWVIYQAMVWSGTPFSNLRDII